MKPKFFISVNAAKITHQSTFYAILGVLHIVDSQMFLVSKCYAQKVKPKNW